MAVQIWYRGEGVNVAPAKVGGSRHDLKDGVYYADTQNVASTYASERAPSPGDRRVYQVSVEMGQMRVLDLTTHPEWKKLMEMKLPSGDTPELMLKRQPSAQEYEKWFDSFLRITKLDTKDFDAVIGPEFRNGGKEMCILSKNGQPSTFAELLRKNHVPIGAGAVPASPPGRLRFAGKIGRGLKAVKGSVGGGIAMVGIAILGTMTKRKFDQMVIEESMKKISSNIDTRIRDLAMDVALVLANQKKAFVNITIDRIETTAIDYSTMRSGGASTTEMATFVLNDVKISDADVSQPESEVKEEREIQSYAYALKYRSVYSVEVTMSKEEVDLCAAFVKELRWYEDTLRGTQAREDVERLSRDKAALESKFREAFK